MRARFNRRRFLELLGAAGLFAAAGGGAGAAGAAPVRRVGFLLDITPYGKHAMFYVPLAKGYWRTEGLDVAINHAQGSADCVTKVGAGAATFGFADAGSAVIGRANGVPVKEIFMIHYKNLECCIGSDEKPIRKPRDMEGKAIGATSGDAPRAVLPVLAKINDLDLARIHLITVEQLSKPAAIFAGRLDGAFDYFTAYPAYEAAAAQKGRKATHFLFADYGLDIYNNGIIATDSTLRADPDLARRFLRGLAKGIAYTVGHPEAATDILLKYQPGLTKTVALAQLRIAIDHLMVPEVKEHGIGPMDAARMEKTVQVISQSYHLPKPVTTSQIYTNAYAPKGVLP